MPRRCARSIEAQLAAFAADDADKAFSYAAPGIRALFITAERFLSMVREGYPVVYRPASVTFLNQNGSTQADPAHSDDRLGRRPWMVVYEFEHPDRQVVAHRGVRGCPWGAARAT